MLTSIFSEQASAQTLRSSINQSSTAEDVLGALRDKLDQNYLICDVSHGDVNKILKDASGDAINEAVSQLSDKELKDWAGEITGMFCGLDKNGRREIYGMLAEKLNPTQQVRFFNALGSEYNQKEFATVIGQISDKSGFSSVAKDFAAELAKGTQSVNQYGENLKTLLDSGFTAKEIGAFIKDNPHKDLETTVTILHKDSIAKQKDHDGRADCVTTMMDVYRNYFGDGDLGKGLRADGIRYSDLLPQMARKGYATDLGDFTFNGSKFTELKDATTLTRSVGDAIKAQGPGIYAIGVANGVHTMTLVYDGKNFILHDQGTGWDKTFSSVSELDKGLESTTKDMLRVRGVQPNYSAILEVYRLN